MNRGNKKYEVLDNGSIIGKDLYLDSALALVRGYFETYPEEGVELTIKEAERSYLKANKEKKS